MQGEWYIVALIDIELIRNYVIPKKAVSTGALLAVRAFLVLLLLWNNALPGQSTKTVKISQI